MRAVCAVAHRRVNKNHKLACKRKEGLVELCKLPVREHLRLICKTFDGFGKTADGFLCITFLNVIVHAMIDVAFEYDLSAFVKCRFRSFELGGYVFARHIFVDHTIDALICSIIFASRVLIIQHF